MASEPARTIAEAYRWQRRLGLTVIAGRSCRIVADPAHPDVWDANHADEVTAESAAEIESVFADMDAHLAHAPRRVVHTDVFTPDAFLARLALEDFTEWNVTIQMALEGGLADRGAEVALRPIASEADWEALLELVVANHAEQRAAHGLDLTPEFSKDMVAVYRRKNPDFRFHLAIHDGTPIAYGACGAAPNGAGMIEDLYTTPSMRRRGVGTGLIAAFVDRLRAAGCHTIFLGALAHDQPKRLYARLGFRPGTLARMWVGPLRAIWQAPATPMLAATAKPQPT